MIKGNIIELGYGDVLCYGDQIEECAVFVNTKPPFTPGYIISHNDRYEKDMKSQIKIKFDCDDALWFCKILKELEEESNGEGFKLGYRGYVFDFTKYHEGSVKSVYNAVKNSINWNILAC